MSVKVNFISFCTYQTIAIYIHLPINIYDLHNNEHAYIYEQWIFKSYVAALVITGFSTLDILIHKLAILLYMRQLHDS